MEKNPTEVSPPSAAFNYARFTEYLEVQNSHERQLRHLYRCQGKALPWLSLSYYTDSVLEEELRKIYGDMDRTSPIYARIFSTYKEDRLEQIEEWIQEEKKIIKDRFESGHKLIDPQYLIPREEEITVSNNFTSAELDTFNQVRSQESKQPFLLPRVQVQIQKAQLQNSESRAMGIGSNKMQLMGKNKNNNSNNPKLDCRDLCLDSQQVVTKPNDIFANILHKLECTYTLTTMKASTSHVCLATAFAQLQDMFSVQVTLENVNTWGFENLPTFVAALLRMFECSKLGLVTSNDLSLPGKDFYIVPKSNLRECRQGVNVAEEHIPRNTLPKNKIHLNSKRILPANIDEIIPYHCMQLGERIETCSEWMASPDSIRRRKEFPCLLLNYYTPTDFYIVLWQNWNQLNQFQTALTSSYENLDSTSPGDISIPRDFDFSEGLYLVVIQYREGSKDYYRGQYVEGCMDGTHRIYMVDYGEFVNAKLTDLRFLRKCMAHELRLQAIWCGIHNILPQIEWNQEVVDMTYDLIHHKSKPFAAKFINQIDFKGKEQWFIKASGVDRKKYPDVGVLLKNCVPSLDVDTAISKPSSSSQKQN